jgi:hypothetical protein
MSRKNLHIVVMGFPANVGGACTELYHTVSLWRKHLGWDVTVVKTWGDVKQDEHYDKLVALGCSVPSGVAIDTICDQPGDIFYGMCNAEFLKAVPVLKAGNKKTAWSNCMCWAFDDEIKVLKSGGFDAYHFQSNYQRLQLAIAYKDKAGYDLSAHNGQTIRGAFDTEGWDWSPRPHHKQDPFVIGRAARADADKWSSMTWEAYSKIGYANVRILMLGMNDVVLKKLGMPPNNADVIRPNGLQAKTFFRELHATMPINGGAAENWPRAGLEAMALGPVVIAQNDWGWTEMIEHEVTGYLGNDVFEMAHYASVLAYDEKKRMAMSAAARRRMEGLSDPKTLAQGWKSLIEAAL